jgi:hypothetical protein
MDKQLLERLCNQYGYTYRELGNKIRITSARDAWYIPAYCTSGYMIKLDHENTRGNTETHPHGKHRNLYDIFKAIYSHDTREQHRNNKYTRIDELFQKINTIYN